jgi:hypothetical protein
VTTIRLVPTRDAPRQIRDPLEPAGLARARAKKTADTTRPDPSTRPTRRVVAKPLKMNQS